VDAAFAGVSGDLSFPSVRSATLARNPLHAKAGSADRRDLFCGSQCFRDYRFIGGAFRCSDVSAHQIALNFSSLVFMVPLSFGIASITRVGQALGENDPHRARFASWVTLGMALGFAVISALAIAIWCKEIAAMYTSDEAIQTITMNLLLFAALFQLSDATQVAASSAIRGYKVTRTPMIIHMIAFWVISIPLGCTLGLAPTWLPWRPAAPMAATGFWISSRCGSKLRRYCFGLVFA